MNNNHSTGWVRLFRSVQTKGWYKKQDYAHLWIHLLILASHSGYEAWLNGSPITLRPGQLITGRKKLSKETGISESKIDRILKLFKSEQQIEQQTFNTCRLISINNWAKYQKSEQQIEQQTNSGWTAGEQRVNTIQECKEGLIMLKTLPQSDDVSLPEETITQTPLQTIPQPEIQVAPPAPPDHALRGVVVYDAEAAVLSNQIEFENICLKTGAGRDNALKQLRLYNLYLQEKERYPMGKKAVFAGFEKWLINSNDFNKHKKVSQVDPPPVKQFNGGGLAKMRAIQKEYEEKVKREAMNA